MSSKLKVYHSHIQTLPINFFTDLYIRRDTQLKSLNNQNILRFLFFFLLFFFECYSVGSDSVFSNANVGHYVSSKFFFIHKDSELCF